MSAKIKWNESQLNNIYRLYLQGNSCNQIAMILSVSKCTIIKIIRESEIEFRKVPARGQKDRVYSCDEGFFDNLDNEYAAYWASFIAGDGSIQKRNLIVIDLEKCNESYQHLENFINCIKGNHKIYEGEKLYRVQVCSTELVDNLKRYNIHENKVYTVSPPELKSNMIRHYYRGIIDADGCLDLHRRARISLVGNFEIVNGFKNYCLSVDRRIMAELFQTAENDRIYRFSTAGEFGIKIMHDLYRECKVAHPKCLRRYQNIIDEW